MVVRKAQLPSVIVKRQQIQRYIRTVWDHPYKGGVGERKCMPERLSNTNQKASNRSVTIHLARRQPVTPIDFECSPAVVPIHTHQRTAAHRTGSNVASFNQHRRSDHCISYISVAPTPQLPSVPLERGGQIATYSRGTHVVDQSSQQSPDGHPPRTHYYHTPTLIENNRIISHEIQQASRFHSPVSHCTVQ